MPTSVDDALRSSSGEKPSFRLMLPAYVLFVVFATALPLTIILSVELWMATAYTGGIDLKMFLAQYETGIYKYRILGREILLHVYYFLASHAADRPYLLPRDPEGSFLLYGAFAICNGVYLLLSNLLLLSLLWVKRSGLPDRETSIYLYYTLLLAMSMAVVTPYDQLAYLLLLIGILGARTKSSAIGICLVSFSAIAGTLNRETEFLLAAFLTVLAFFSPPYTARRYWIYLAADITLSLAVYIGVRLVIPGRASIIQGITFGGKWPVESVLILILLVAAAIALALRLHPNILPSLMFIVVSIPYFITILIGGVFRELRLMVPVILCLLSLYVLLSRAPETLLPNNEHPCQ